MTKKKPKHRHGLSPLEKFFNKTLIVPFHTCWEWTDYKDKD